MSRFYTCYYQSRREDKNSYAVSAVERVKKESVFHREYLSKVIAESNSENFADVLKTDKTWWSFFHLSEMRKGLFAWYDFCENAELLEVDAGFGALTGLFCDKCKNVVATDSSIKRAEAIAQRYKSRENLEVYAGAVEDFDYSQFTGRFDYIVLNDVLERKGYGYGEQKAYLEYLDLMKSMLKPKGKILLVVTNRHGIKYFCGARDKFSGKPFDGINHYPNGTEGYAFEKGELIRLLQASGLNKYKFFYPLPDARMPQIICTDEYYGDNDVAERITFYDEEEDTLLARERCLYKDFMQNGVFGYFANSFFVEASVESACSNVKYAVVAADRGEERSFATVIYNDGVVKKQPLCKKAEETAQQSVTNIRRLESRGIRVVEHQLDKGNIVMPYVKAKTLSAVMKECVKTDKKRYVQLFDLLYEQILKSSEYVSNQFDEEEGPVLKECYFDMVPVNCFFIDGELVFFDQEFLKKNFPAKYTLYRAIKYTYMSMWELQDYFPKEILLERYQLTNQWERFEQEETSFIMSLRNAEENSQLHEWSNTDEQRIYHRGENLSLCCDEKQIAEAPDWIENVQIVQLRLLKKFISVCEKYGFRYYAFRGTLLGAVRHKGFVPWDDDTDVAMPREDYERLKKIAKIEFDEPYFLQTVENDHESFYGGYGRLRFSDSTAIEVRNWGKDTNHGIWLDILPLDNIVNDQTEKEKFCKELHEIQRKLLAKVYGQEENFLNMSKETFAKYKELAKEYSYEELTEQLQKKLQSIEESDYVAVMASYHGGNYVTYEKGWFGEGIVLPFEGMQIRVPDKYKEILKKQYGEVYYAVPSLERQASKHEVFFNAKVPYKKYLQRFNGIFDKAEEREYIIVGTTELADTFIDRNYKKIHISFVADDNKQGTEFWGYPVKAVSEIRSIPQEKRAVVVCNKQFSECEKILKKEGIDDYYIYIHDKWWILGNNQ